MRKSTPTEDDLVPEDRDRLEQAQRDLASAVAEYERFIDSRALGYGDKIQVAGASELAVAQRAVETAEDNLWSLRQELLGWARPAWAPRASLTADWFSKEDSIYDDPEAPS